MIREAPASTAATATSSLVVSTESRTWPASASTTGTTRCSSSSTGHRFGPGPGRLAAHVHDVGAFGDHLLGPLDGTVPVEPQPAVGERVRGHVEDGHDQGSVLASEWA